MGDEWAFPATAALTEDEAAQYSPIRFVAPDLAPSLIVYGDLDRSYRCSKARRCTRPNERGCARVGI